MASILVAEDEEMIRDMMSLYLKEFGYDHEVVADGMAALERFQAQPFDLLITDQSMPFMTGDQLAVEVKKLKPGVPVILLTGYGALMGDESNLPPGVDFILAKPFTIEGLLQALGKFLG